MLDACSLARSLAELPPTNALLAYEADRRPKTEEIVLSNRRGGPERVVDAVSERAPNGFERLEDVIHPKELTAISGGYAAMAGFAAPAPES